MMHLIVLLVNMQTLFQWHDGGRWNCEGLAATKRLS